jgi:dTDP-4-dehydrorhamnose 3,5-epimerase
VKFTELPLPGAMLVEQDAIADERGAFGRLFCEREFAAHGLETRFPQWSLSRNTRLGTLRGMHYAVEPYAEVKLVRVGRGAIYDVILDLRPESPTYLRWHAVELDAARGAALYVPKGLAHGFQSLEDDTDVVYHISAFYEPGAARAVRWNDPAFGIEWPPTAERIMSARDRDCPDFAA